MTYTEQNKWEEKYNVATQRADFFEPNTLVIPINSAILLTRMLLTEAIAQAIAEERERVVGEINKQKVGLWSNLSTKDAPEYMRNYNQALDDLLYSLDNPLTNKDMKTKNRLVKEELCPFCKKRENYVGVICPCEVENTGMEEFWKD